MLKSIISSLILILFCAQASFAKLIIISDIDDTIKRSHVLDRTDAVTNAMRTNYAFAGMSELYRAFAKSAKFYYLSNAPKALMYEAHANFLKQSNFPAGTLLLKSLFEQDHKANAITDILNTEKPDQVILIGDNGEQDIYIYADIVAAFQTKPIEFLTLIRQAYDPLASNLDEVGQPMAENQLGFVTAGELALELFNVNLLSKVQVMKVIKATLMPGKEVSAKEVDSEVHLPLWLDCHSHQFAPLGQDFISEVLAQDLLQKSQARCAGQ